VTWSEQEKIETAAPGYLRNVVRIISETGLRVYKELASMRKEDVDLANAIVCRPVFKKVLATTLWRAGVGYFRIYDLRSTYAACLSTEGVADEWVTRNFCAKATRRCSRGIRR
jgi:integrase